MLAGFSARKIAHCPLPIAHYFSPSLPSGMSTIPSQVVDLTFLTLLFQAALAFRQASLQLFEASSFVSFVRFLVHCLYSIALSRFPRMLNFPSQVPDFFAFVRSQSRDSGLGPSLASGIRALGHFLCGPARQATARLTSLSEVPDLTLFNPFYPRPIDLRSNSFQRKVRASRFAKRTSLIGKLTCGRPGRSIPLNSTYSVPRNHAFHQHPRAIVSELGHSLDHHSRS